MQRMMRSMQVLININNLNEIEDYKKIGITNFLFPIEEFSIGYNSFELKDIPADSYIFMNRVLDSKDIDKLKELKDEIVKYKGIIFEDIGVFNIFKDTGIELIWNQSHFVNNYSSINCWFKLGATSCVVANDITKEEIKEIIEKVDKPVIFNILGKNQVMYSRRTLLSNFNTYAGVDDIKNANIYETHTDVNFNLKESEYGTVTFSNEYFNYIEFAKELDQDKILYELVLNQDLSVDEIKEILDGKPFGNDGFLNKKTVYKMEDYGKKVGA